MRLTLVAVALLLGATSTVAGTLSCPDPSTAVQVGTCPTEKELQYTYTGYCGDNARLYDKDKITCATYDNYRRAKNVALWESRDGEFHAYLSCDLPKNALKDAKAERVSVNRQGKLTRVVCAYGEDITFVHRAKSECRVEGDGNCVANPAACKVRCN
jgi:hypothetical protein